MPDFLVKAGSRWPKRRDFLGRGGRCNRNELLLRWGRKRYRQRQQPSRRETLRQSHHAAALLATAPTICTAALINRISVTRMTPTPRSYAHPAILPLLQPSAERAGHASQERLAGSPAPPMTDRDRQ